MKLYQKISWKFLQLTFGFYCRFILGLTLVDSEDEPDGSYILLGNHAHHIDAFFIGAFLKRPIHFLGSDEIASVFQQILGKLVGIIYTKKGTIDPGSVREMFKIIKRGGSIGIYPEGDGTWDGETDKIFFNIIKLIKRFRSPLRLARQNGAYMTKPRWGKGLSRGKINVSFKNISIEEIKSKSDEELYEAVKNYLYNNDIKDKELNKTGFKSGNRAGGIEYLLWKCPACGSTDKINGHKNRIICKSCHKVWKVDNNLKLTGSSNSLKDIKDWNDWQNKELQKDINNPDKIMLTQSNNVELSLFIRYSKGINRKKMLFNSPDKGNLVFIKEKIIFVPSNNENKNVELKIEKIKYYAECVNKFFLIHYEDKIYKINFNKKNSSRYIYLLRYLTGYYDDEKISRNVACEV